MNKTCCFAGSCSTFFDEFSQDSVQIKSLLKNEIEKAIKEGYDCFITGMNLGFDMWAAEAVIELRKKYPHIKLVAALPGQNQEENWSHVVRAKYKYLLMRVDVLYYVHRGIYEPYYMVEKDKHIVDKSSLLITMFDENEGGVYAFDYALKKGIHVIQITKDEIKHYNQ
jgi:uncharacterized phage-like protein YoqJ